MTIKRIRFTIEQDRIYPKMNEFLLEVKTYSETYSSVITLYPNDFVNKFDRIIDDLKKAIKVEINKGQNEKDIR